jgi:hypothetical protein
MRISALRWYRGSTSTEYVAVLLGLLVVWQGAQAALTLLREHHTEFSWVLMIPF